MRPWLIGAVYAGVLLPLSFQPKISGNVSSRYMTIEAMVERWTLAIESSPLLRGSGSPDLVKFGRHFYSDKPPVLPALGAIVYTGLYLAGDRFSGSPAQYVLANLVLVWTIVGISSGLTLVALRDLFQTVAIPRWAADGLTLAFGFVSLLLSYGVTFNNHSVAAALVTGALALTITEGTGRLRIRTQRFLIGLLAGLAATIDLPVGGILLLVLAVWLTARAKSFPLAYAMGALPPLLLHCVLQSLITGTPLPTEMYPEAFAYPGSYWATEAGVWKETGPRWQFGLELLFGPQGWFTITPVLLLGAVGLAIVLAHPHDSLRPAAFAVATVVVLLLGYYVWGVRRTDYAGQSFGTRHLLAITPACYYFAVVALERLRSRLAWTAFGLLMAVGAAYAISGVRDPWSRVEKHSQRGTVVRTLQRGVLYPWSSYRR